MYISFVKLINIQVLNEQHKLQRVIETTGPPELTEAREEVERLKNELKVRSKLNELQSAKVWTLPMQFV